MTPDPNTDLFSSSLALAHDASARVRAYRRFGAVFAGRWWSDKERTATAGPWLDRAETHTFRGSAGTQSNAVLLRALRVEMTAAWTILGAVDGPFDTWCGLYRVERTERGRSVPRDVEDAFFFYATKLVDGAYNGTIGPNGNIAPWMDDSAIDPVVAF